MNPKPVCFVVMPFGTKETGAAPPAPATVDFDALWRHAIKPAIESLQYRVVRADEDRGALIIHEMIERLYYSDLVIADVSIPNANVYYEVGLRHAARNTGCVLIGADWGRVVFDMAQMRRITYPLPHAAVSDETAQAIRDALVNGIPQGANTATPPPEIISGLQEPQRPERSSRSSVLADQLEEYDALYQDLNAIRDAGGKADAAAWLGRNPASAVRTPYVAAMTVPFVRDLLSWSDTVAYIEALPASIREHAFIREQEALARAKGGSHLDAVTILSGLIRRAGSTPEREGLLGGRYKKLYFQQRTADAGEARRYLGKAIDHYERGMRLDLNAYYCSCNLPALYRERNGPGDEERALSAAAVARAACQRCLDLGLPDDGWLRQTLLGLTFAERNPAAAEDLLERVRNEGAARWQLESTLVDLETHLRQIRSTAPPHAERFERLVAALEVIVKG